MTFEEYQAQALRTAGPLCRGSLTYSMGGIGGEAGEYIDVVKKYLFHDKPQETSRVSALLELGDLLWGIAQAADAWGFTLEQVAEGNVEKLKARFPDGFSVQAAAEKADELRCIQGPEGDPCGEPCCVACECTEQECFCT